MRRRRWRFLTTALATAAMIGAAIPGGATGEPAMAQGVNGWEVSPIFTVGETINGYTAPGVLDGLGAYELDENTVRVFANHELLNFRGYEYVVNGSISMVGARISYFDIDKETRQVVDSGLAYDTVYDGNGDIPTDISFLANDLAGFTRFCSGGLSEVHQFGNGSGLEDRIFFAGEEDGGFFSSVGGAEWALDPATGSLWHLPDLGRGAWENIALVNTQDPATVAVILADDTSPFDMDGDGDNEAAPLFMYVGEKDPGGDFPARNGLRGGTLYVWVATNGATSPTDFNTFGRLRGTWVEIDNTPDLTQASEDGSTGFDEYGYPTQATLWTRAETLGAFGFSRPEDVATNPGDGREVVIASTGVDTYEGGIDTFGTIYRVRTSFPSMNSVLIIVYDGDADPNRSLRSPDNLDWADDSYIYVQEDEAEEDTLTGEVLFGDGAANPNEAGIVRMKKFGGDVERIANIDRTVLLDPTTAGTPVDQDAGDAGEWESSGILDVSTLFGERRGTLFLFTVQAHGIEDQDDFNADSRLTDGDLVEGGQLLFLEQ